MKEEFLHYLWKYGLYCRDKLKDKDGNLITVIHPGTFNRDSGPDFFNARILISGTLWAGNVEIHTSASHFDLHGHNNDPAFDNVILHVVARDDRKVYNSRGEELMTVELSYDERLHDRYMDLIGNPAVIACQDSIAGIDPVLFRQWLSFLAVERLEQKTSPVKKILDETGNDWEEALYRMVCRYFGFRVNSEPFEMLSRTLPSRIIRKHADNILQIEALLFGSAGMLEEGLFRDAINDEYFRTLAREFRILSSKYGITPMHGWLWKFSRLRPVNFPTVRISQLARMLSVSGGLFSRVLQVTVTDGLKALFEVSASEYWEDHYIFGKKTRRMTRRTGSQATGIIAINAVIPLLFVYGRLRGRQDLCDRAVEYLESIPAEENSVIEEWKSTGIETGSAFMSQALIQLRNEYCRKRRCLDCRIGSKLISSGIKLRNDDQIMLEP